MKDGKCGSIQAEKREMRGRIRDKVFRKIGGEKRGNGVKSQITQPRI